MQTIKTSSIVVLLMTVMYGGYVSLTTPPEPIPPEVADLLEFEGDLDIDTGFAASDSFAPGIDEFTTGQPDAVITTGQPDAVIATGPSQGGFANPGRNIPQAGSTPSSNSTAPASMSLGSPQTGTSTPRPQPSFQAQNSVSISDQGPTFSGLPKASTPAKAVSVDLNSAFPATEGSFQLPTPANAQDNFNPQTGRSFNAPQNTSPPPAAGAMSLPSMDNLPSLDQAQTELTEQVSLNADPAASNQIALANQSAIGAVSAGATTENVGLANAFTTADRQYANDQMREALATLSVFYGTPDLPVAQRGQLLARLDPLAREVIYSPRHLLEQPHRVGSNETLMEIAQNYGVPWQLIANINGIKDPLVITPGTELKVVRGPFNAQVDLRQHELTIFLGDLYAGRFPIAVGSDPAPRPGTFTVQDKQSQRTFYDRSGAPIAAGSPANPYGKVWIDLGSQLCIHGSPEATKPTANGCISLAANFADDLFGILSQGSSVTIRR
ncbi:L,D-transpeptidase family protein [Stieleria marina]|uniref:LysM domain protein n=1 Tax=Stieleria marina TaxID=1930275 RepID=A0A517NW54_9BACT|nr:LysM domain protein [Planctomycetes bacterium K23_9]